MAKAVKVTVAKKTCPMGQHAMPNGKCMKDSVMKKAMPSKPGGPPIKGSSGY